MPSESKLVRVSLEVGAKRVFASAIDWPGWCRSAKNEQGALDALEEYAARYAQVAGEAGIDFKPSGFDLEVIETVPGDATTDFGAPGAIAPSDHQALSESQAKRHRDLLAATWAVSTEVAAESPEELRKGPRGGGRDRDKMIDHVIGAETMYARKIGVRHRQPAIDDIAGVEELRQAILAVVAKPLNGQPVGEKGWPVRYAVRRMA